MKRLLQEDFFGPDEEHIGHLLNTAAQGHLGSDDTLYHVIV